MAAVNAVISLIASFFPLASLFIAIFLPAASAIAARLSKPAYVPVYVVGASLLSVAFSYADIGTGLFYVVPAIVSGSLLGLALRRRELLGLSFFLASLVNMAFVYLSFPLIEALTGADFIAFFLNLLGLAEDESAREALPLFFFAYGAAGSGLSALFVSFIPFKQEERPKKRIFSSFEPVFAGVFVIVSLVLVPYHAGMALLFEGFAAVLALLGVPLLAKRPFPFYLVLLLFELLMIFPYVLLNEGGSLKSGLLIASVFLVPLILFEGLSLALPRKGRKPKMEPR